MKPIMRDPKIAPRSLLAAAITVVAMLGAGTVRADHFDVDLWLDRGGEAVYEPGDPIQIGVRASNDAYILVYEIDAEGYLHLLFPHGPSGTFVDGNATLQLPNDESEQLVVQGPVGEGYVVAIASREPFADLPWYLRPRNAQAEALGYDDEQRDEEGITPEGRIVGDPFVAMEKVRRAVLQDPTDGDAFSSAYTTYYVHQEVQYPRYLCYDCHRPGYWSWWDGFDPYYTTCSVFTFRVNAGWWWGPSYWFGAVPYYVYAYRPDCPPRYRPYYTAGYRYSSWDGWRRWQSLWGGTLRRFKSPPPAGYVPPPSAKDSQWTRLVRPRPPGFMPAHQGDAADSRSGAGLRRERHPWPGMGGDTRTPRDVGNGSGDRAPRGGGDAGDGSGRANGGWQRERQPRDPGQGRMAPTPRGNDGGQGRERQPRDPGQGRMAPTPRGNEGGEGRERRDVIDPGHDRVLRGGWRNGSPSPGAGASRDGNADFRERLWHSPSDQWRAQRERSYGGPSGGQPQSGVSNGPRVWRSQGSQVPDVRIFRGSGGGGRHSEPRVDSGSRESANQGDGGGGGRIGRQAVGGGGGGEVRTGGGWGRGQMGRGGRGGW